MRTLVKNGTVITATDEYVGDILIDGEVISAIGTSLDVPADRIIDATDRLVIPGGVDVHTHLDMPTDTALSSDDFQTGTIAAAFGGTTTIVDYATQDRGRPMREAFDTWMAKAEGKAVIDYGFHMIIRELTADWSLEMQALVDSGVTSFKLFTAYPGVLMLDDGSIFRVMQRSGEIGALIAMHAENGGVIDVLVQQALARGNTGPKYHALTRPPRAEAEATHRVACLAEMAGVPVYIVHLSAPEALIEARRARERGVKVYAETCPQYLFLDDTMYDEPGFAGAKYVMSPPLRAREGQDVLWRGLADRDLQVVATDHCPFCLADKRLGADDFSKIPNGAPGIETRVGLVYDGGVRQGRISRQRWVELMATAPAKMFGLFPRKGTIAPGSDADIVIFDPARVHTLSASTLHMRIDYNPYEGRDIRGVCETVLSRGRVIIEDGQLVASPGVGRYVARGPTWPE